MARKTVTTKTTKATKTTKTKKTIAKKTAPKKTAPKVAATPRAKGPTTKNLDIYGSAPIPWSRALEQLETGAPGGSYWLATTRPNGRPHVPALGALWVGGKIYFPTSSRTRQGRNPAPK